MFYKKLPSTIYGKIKVLDAYEFYQSDKYLKIESKSVKADSQYWVYENDVSNEFIVLCLLIRPIASSQYFDSVSPYGYPGYLSNSNSINFLKEAFDIFNQECEENNIVSTFIRLNPLFNYVMLIENKNMKQVIHGNVITVPLEKDYIDIHTGYSSNHKRSIKKLNKLQYKIVEGGKESIDSFIDIYNSTMSRLGADNYYFFSREYYLSLFEMGFSVEMIFVENDKGKKVSGALFMANDEIIQYHLGGTLENEVKTSPNKLIFDYIIDKFSTEKKYLNLGGGLGNNEDSLFEFKKGFSDTFRKFSTLRMVHIPNQYANLCKSFNKHEVRDLTSYFPLYRKEL